MEIVSFAHYGYEGEIVKVEADLRRGIPAIDIVGLPDGAVREARDRMRAAIRNSGLDFPRERILINLSPAGLKKEGSSFDLPIALAVLGAAVGLGENTLPLRIMVLGELELSGTVRAVRGILAAVSLGIERGIRQYIVPEENCREAEVCSGITVIGVRTLGEAFHRLTGLEPSGSCGEAGAGRAPLNDGGEDAYTVRWSPPGAGFNEVRGQNRLLRALQIAAAGGHHLLAYGPAGCGKTLTLRRFPLLLPELDRETAVTVTRVYSIAGLPVPESGLAREAPFREPHPGASQEGMTGGGHQLRPGEISLAHGGALFLDEAGQFKSSVLQSLRAPIETGRITVSRAGRSTIFPARFQLLLSMNPCPCGNFGVEGRICVCAPESVENYWKRLTAPLLDRVDLRVAVGPPDPKELSDGRGLDIGVLRTEIGRARLIQWNRNRGAKPVSGAPDTSRESAKFAAAGPDWLNAALDPEDTNRVCVLGPGVREIFVRCVAGMQISGRGAHGILKVARTIADLDGSGTIEEDHLLEAAQYRRWGDGIPAFL